MKTLIYVFLFSILACNSVFGNSDRYNSWDLIDYSENSSTYENLSLGISMLVSNYSVSSFGNTDLREIANVISIDQNCNAPIDETSLGLGFLMECAGNLKIFVLPSEGSTVNVAMTDCNDNFTCSHVAEFIKEKNMKNKLVRVNY